LEVIFRGSQSQWAAAGAQQKRGIPQG
jgi:hypothetical protein